MDILNKVKENVNFKEGVTKISAKISDMAQSGKEIGEELFRRNRERKENDSEEELEEKGTKMLKVMDWAFEKANSNIPGLGSAAIWQKNTWRSMAM